MTQIVIRRRVPRPRSWILLAVPGLLAVLAWTLPAPAKAPDDARWRRTRDGWEQIDCRAYDHTRFSPAFHPLCLATLQMLLAAMALVAGDGTAWSDLPRSLCGITKQVRRPRQVAPQSTFREAKDDMMHGLPRPSFLRLDGLGRPSSDALSTQR